MDIPPTKPDTGTTSPSAKTPPTSPEITTIPILHGLPPPSPSRSTLSTALSTAISALPLQLQPSARRAVTGTRSWIAANLWAYDDGEEERKLAESEWEIWNGEDVFLAREATAPVSVRLGKEEMSLVEGEMEDAMKERENRPEWPFVVEVPRLGKQELENQASRKQERKKGDDVLVAQPGGFWRREMTQSEMVQRSGVEKRWRERKDRRMGRREWEREKQKDRDNEVMEGSCWFRSTLSGEWLVERFEDVENAEEMERSRQLREDADEDAQRSTVCSIPRKTDSGFEVQSVHGGRESSTKISESMEHSSHHMMQATILTAADQPKDNEIAEKKAPTRTESKPGTLREILESRKEGKTANAKRTTQNTEAETKGAEKADDSSEDDSALQSRRQFSGLIVRKEEEEEMPFL